MKIEGSSTLVTGGASGLGEATARMLAAHGAIVHILDRNPEAAERLADEIGGLALSGDVTDEADAASALDVARTPYTLKFFELINSPQGPWLQMLQRVYYTDDPIDQVIADAKAQMKAIAAE